MASFLTFRAQAVALLLALSLLSAPAGAVRLKDRSVHDYVRTAELVRDWQRVSEEYDLSMVEGEGLNHSLRTLKELGGTWLEDNEGTQTALDLALILNQNGYRNLFDYYEAGFSIAAAYFVIRYGDQAGEHMQGLMEVDLVATSTRQVFNGLKGKLFGSQKTADKVIGVAKWAVDDRNIEVVRRNFEIVESFFESNATPNDAQPAAPSTKAELAAYQAR